ncbi:ferredoxin-type protein NapG [Sulfurimonas sp.]|jgi:ferredoxin-type protein NapG|uniref:ferredoxin-type protein NapG n=1 Tax=Sulfurimonas sp. TaxID=2022749 RepID=UPI0025D8DF88|nr:ferredoxin-type protein NapG [Sulfurimonas sp.]MCK9474040.1 ferredoxin-type protein NapG [Sulfurimonas sp.]
MNKINTPDRRLFLQKILSGVGYASVGAIFWSAYLSKSQAQSLLLRPPGALLEKDFLSTCMRCGMCVKACPFDVLQLATISDKTAIGTPYFTPRENACRLCPDIPCASSCPTDALDLKSLTKDNSLHINNAKMGLATVNTQSCLAYLGLQCTMCIRACPLADVAIVLKNERNPRTGMHAFLTPMVDATNCTGCGLCERACPTNIASIKVLPLFLSQSDIGSHYIIGWKKEDEERLKKSSTDVTMSKTKRNEKSALDNVNDVEGILEGLYHE